MERYFEREILISFSIILGAILFLGTASFFLARDVSSEAKMIVSDRSLVSQRAADLSALAELKKDSAEASRYRQIMGKILVTQDQLLDFPKWLEGFARGRQLNYSFSFLGNSIEPSEETPGYTSFSLGLNGGLDGLIGLLKDIEVLSPRFLVSVDNFSTRRNDPSYSFSLNGRVFFTKK